MGRGVGGTCMIRVGFYLACYPEIDGLWSFLPPLGLGYLAAYTRERVPGVEFVVHRRLEDLIAARPDVVGVTYVTHNARFAAGEARKIKEALGCPVIAGGPHISTLPTVLDAPFDLAVLHEGEATFADLMRLYQAERRFEPAALAKVEGILYRDESGALLRTPPRPTIADLDAIPYPDRDLMFDQWRLPGRVEAQLMSSRGCPYDCAFCSTVKHWGTGYRFPSEAYVVGEIELLRERYGAEVIHFYDDLFVVRKDRVLSILKLMRERGLHEGAEYRCFVRSNLLDDEVMEAFAASGFRLLNIGFESGSDEILQILNKGSASMKKNRRAIELGRKHGLKFASCFIIGSPGETRQSILETFDFVTSNVDALQYVQFAPLVILPGTEVWRWAERIGVSDRNLTGVVLEPEDINNEDHYYLHRWPYLNDENIPREEFLTYLKIGHKIEELVWRHHGLGERLKALERESRRVQTPGYIAENTPILDIVKAKARRRLRRLLPSDPELSLESA